MMRVIDKVSRAESRQRDGLKLFPLPVAKKARILVASP